MDKAGLCWQRCLKELLFMVVFKKLILNAIFVVSLAAPQPPALIFSETLILPTVLPPAVVLLRNATATDRRGINT